MNSDLQESIDTALPILEEIRERIIATEATKANRAALDRAYVAVVDALDTLTRLYLTARVDSKCICQN